ncbi:fibronectin type III-like domain-contianing protein [Nocardiopsis sp. CNT312]|uniref:fibronectin type III-like domain-contianing protein n=1 Tax=Nocardiopsis sp. CNT312 TaxID=1137268 RepID=UPI00048CB64B
MDPAPLFPFGHGLSYTRFTWSYPLLDGCPTGEGAVALPTDGEVTVGCTVRNDGPVRGTEVVQLYLSDPVAAVTGPVRRLIGYARLDLEPGQESGVESAVHADLAAYTGPDPRRIVDPGDLVPRLSASCADPGIALRLRLHGPVREVGPTRRPLAQNRIRGPRIHPG